MLILTHRHNIMKTFNLYNGKTLHVMPFQQSIKISKDSFYKSPELKAYSEGFHIEEVKKLDTPKPLVRKAKKVITKDISIKKDHKPVGG